MSFLTEVAFRRVATLQVPRTLAASAPRAAFSCSMLQQRSAVDTAKEGLKQVDRTVSDKIVDGINIGGMCNMSTRLSRFRKRTPVLTSVI